MGVFRGPHQMNDIGQITQHNVIVMGRGMQKSYVFDICQTFSYPFLDGFGQGLGFRLQGERSLAQQLA